ncbi:MAG: LysM peptidoglycan-binding domain-containing protein, partial [Duncaniella sp.]|nr:LysM peptidoglycan-binding domain-containing protein [Duncaniella sp.]
QELTALATAPAAAESTETAQAAQETAAKNVEKPRQNTSRTTTPQTTVHKVKKGDTLGSIAAKYHTTVAAIQGVNGMKKTATSIRIGQTLKIPAKGTPTKAPAKKKTSKRRRR